MGQVWTCENEECWRDISGDGERFQCSGCDRWFCVDCVKNFMQPYDGIPVYWVCGDCMSVWVKLCRCREIPPTMDRTVCWGG
jgi:hypothetical protein